MQRAEPTSKIRHKIYRRLPDAPSVLEDTATARWAVLVVVLILGASFLGLFWHSYSANDGHAVFALDDPYIHLAMARNLSQHGVWGVTAGAFSATSSAPLFTLLLAMLFLSSGPTIVWSWCLAAGGGILVAWLIAKRFADHFRSKWLIVVGSLWCIVVAGIPESMFTGLEHMLHAVSILIVAHFLSRYAGQRRPGRTHDLLLLCALFVAAGLRYESLFAVPFVFGYLFWQGHRGLGAQAAIAAVIPGLIIGFIQLANGAMILPNSLLLKGVAGHEGGLGYLRRFFVQIDSPYIPVFMIIAASGILWATIRRRRLKDEPNVAGTGLFLTMVLMHALFAQLDNRYIPYLIALAIWAAIPWISEWTDAVRTRLYDSDATSSWQTVVVWVVILCGGIFPFANRIEGLGRLPKLGHDVYLQQYQMARFFSGAFAGQAVALNDIGAIAWAGQNPVLDLWGLGDSEIALKRFRQTYSTSDIHDAVNAAGVSAVAVYPHWFAQYGGMPQEWTLVGVWQLSPGIQVNVAGPQVMFYAPTAVEAQLLSRRLKEFAPSLPAGAIFTPTL